MRSSPPPLPTPHRLPRSGESGLQKDRVMVQPSVSKENI